MNKRPTFLPKRLGDNPLVLLAGAVLLGWLALKLISVTLNTIGLLGLGVAAVTVVLLRSKTLARLRKKP